MGIDKCLAQQPGQLSASNDFEAGWPASSIFLRDFFACFADFAQFGLYLAAVRYAQANGKVTFGHRFF